MYSRPLRHYGTKFHSGRYPYGSGENPYQHDPKRFQARIAQLKAEGLSETEIAKYFGITTTKLRALKGLAEAEIRAPLIEEAERLRAEGLGPTEIARRMGLPNESSVRSLLSEKSKERTYAVSNVVDFLKQQVDERGMIDVGLGVEYELNISRKKLQEALLVLEEEGYVTWKGSQEQVTNPDQRTHTMVLCPPGTEHKEIYNTDEVHSLTEYKFSSDDPYGAAVKKWQYPESMDSDRIMICYAEDGGKERDGLILLRKGVEDISLGESSYAQVRILVDDDHYMKGVAAYGTDDMFPDGVDVIFNTNKSSDVPMEKVLKEIKSNAQETGDPFGVLLKNEGGQTTYIGEDGQEHLNLLNRMREEGDWSDWQDTLPNQFLSKQNLKLVTNQLDITKANKQDEFEEIMSLTQPTLKKEMLESFADDCDAAAVELRAAALPGQKYKVLLPVTSMSDNEAYIPSLPDGTEVALVRFPHAGTFEIPIVTVNNKNQEGKDLFGDGLDAVGVNSTNAQKLSGADFDGDTILVIPTNNKIKVNSRDSLEGLKDFDPSVEYPKTETSKVMTEDNKQKQMGVISNLITDMTIQGASDDELARAVRHSMVVIDAVKHEYDYKKSYEENGIQELKDRYQGHYETNEDGTETWKYGAATLLSRAKSEAKVSKTVGSPYTDPETGEKKYKLDEDRFYTDKNGNVKERTKSSTKMAETNDAYTLVSESRTPVELAYADYANYMKNLGNTARKAALNVENVRQSSTAAKTYATEKEQLESMVKIAESNKPKEREAQRLATSTINALKASDSEFASDKKAVAKQTQRALESARAAVGAKRTTITLTDKQWEAIQAGAVSTNTIRKVYQYVDKDTLKQRATPRKTSTNKVRDGQIARMKAMATAGATRAEIAQAIGVSVSTVQKYLSESE